MTWSCWISPAAISGGILGVRSLCRGPLDCSSHGHFRRSWKRLGTGNRLIPAREHRSESGLWTGMVLSAAGTPAITKPTCSLTPSSNFAAIKLRGIPGTWRYKVGIQNVEEGPDTAMIPLVLLLAEPRAHRDTELPLFLGVSSTAGFGISVWNRDQEKCLADRQKCQCFAKQADEGPPAAAGLHTLSTARSS